MSVCGEDLHALGGDEVQVSDRMRLDWLEQMVDVARAESVAAAVALSLDAVRQSLGFDRAAVLRFDGEMVGVFAVAQKTTSEFMCPDQDVIAALGVPGVVPLPGPVVGTVLLEMLDAVTGAALPLHSEGEPWGALVVGHSRSETTDLSALSMLESLGSTLGMVIEREGVRQRLQESNRRLEAYAYAAAHDLRSPLRRIRSFSQLMQVRLEADEIDRVQISDFAERIASGAERLDVLLGSMLEHATVNTLTVESGEHTDLQAVVRNICDGISELSHEPRPTFMVEGLPEVRVPHTSAERVFRNLIDAIITFSPPDRAVAVEISSHCFDDGVRVRLSDTGEGLSPSLANKLFDLFAQLDEQGSGVSAAVTQLLASGNAKVWLEPERGRGATFVVEFPLSAVWVDAADQR